MQICYLVHSMTIDIDNTGSGHSTSQDKSNGGVSTIIQNLAANISLQVLVQHSI